ncbi:MAG: endonuclease/exonuclease/phosphatase family protein, partial [Planctomycetota bacterium]|nr:endonuclease/exonuclease/phosphatase family protein [Planctomycetota bacterium]
MVRFATYNVHRCIGADGRYDADRVAAVIRELDADVVGLQEVDARYHLENDLDQIEYLQEATGMTAVAGPTLTNHRGYYGNALLTRH